MSSVSSAEVPEQTALPLDSDGKRILAIDGGGMRGLFAIQVLKRIERVLKEKFGPKTTLNSHFDLIAGTSSGAIIGTCLRSGIDLDAIEELYISLGRDMFRRRAIAQLAKLLYKGGDRLAGALLDAVYTPERLSRRLREMFGTDTLRSERLGGADGRYLMVITVRSDTLSPWPITNNPAAKFNAPDRDDSNLDIPLWQLVRASAAAPLYFPPQRIRLGKKSPYDVWFADGAICGYNNPASVAFRTATAPQYRIGWPKGVQKLFILSIGTSDPVSYKNRKRRTLFLELGQGARAIAHSLDTLMINSTIDQDIQCRMLGHTVYGHRLDSEMECLTRHLESADAFQYTRYQKVYSVDEIDRFMCNRIDPCIDSTDPCCLSFFQEEGARYAETTVKASHLA